MAIGITAVMEDEGLEVLGTGVAEVEDSVTSIVPPIVLPMAIGIIAVMEDEGLEVLGTGVAEVEDGVTSIEGDDDNTTV